MGRRVFGVLAMVLAVVSPATSGAQNFGRPSDQWFRVSWEPRRHGAAPALEGYVYNEWVFWVSDVRLRVEGLDAESRPVGETFVWTSRSIAPGDRAYFVSPVVPGATGYRITVASFNVVRGGL